MRSKNKREFLDYYEKYKIIPVLNIDDLSLKNIFELRKMFYYKLGINPDFFKNKDIIEFGPGNGVNAYYLLKKIKIKKITLVDNNPSSLINLKKNLKDFRNINIKNIDITKIKILKKYDVVICENTVPGLKDPKKFFLKLLKFCKPGGVIITTLTDDIGIFFEKIRFLMAKKVLSLHHEPTFQKSVSILSKFFKSHLGTLGKNIRKIDKWVVDNIMHEDWITKKKYFNLNDINSVLIKTGGGLISGMSPRLGNDFQWYKNSNIQSHNQNLVENYNKNRINLLHYSEKFNLENIQTNKDIILSIIKIIKIINKFKLIKKKDDKNNYALIKKMIKKLNTKIYKINTKSKIYNALNEFINFNYKNNKLKYFKSSWGHATNQIVIFKF